MLLFLGVNSAGLDVGEGLVAVHLLGHDLGAGHGVGLALLLQYVVACLDVDHLRLVLPLGVAN